MARYNTVAPVGSQTAAGTLATPNSGLLTTFTGTAPYTVTIANPVLYAGATQTFFNKTSGTVTISTPSGVFSGPAFTSNASTFPIPTITVVQILSDGTNYVVVDQNGGQTIGTTANFSDTLVGTTGSFATVKGTTITSPNGQKTTINNAGTTTSFVGGVDGTPLAISYFLQR